MVVSPGNFTFFNFLQMKREILIHIFLWLFGKSLHQHLITHRISVIINSYLHMVDTSVCLWVQDGGISHVDRMRMQEHWLTEVLSNHLSKQESKKQREENKLERKWNWKSKELKYRKIQWKSKKKDKKLWIRETEKLNSVVYTVCPSFFFFCFEWY